MRTDRTRPSPPFRPAAAAAVVIAAVSLPAVAAPGGEFDLLDALDDLGPVGPLAMAQPYDPYDDPPPPPGGYDRGPSRDPYRGSSGDRPFRPLPVEPDRDRGYDRPDPRGSYDPYDDRGSDPYAAPRGNDYRDPYDDGYGDRFDPYDDPRRDVVGDGRDGGRLRVYERPHFVLRGGVFAGIVGGSEDYEVPGGDDLSALDGGDGVGGIEGALGYEWVDSVGGADATQSVRAELMYRYLVPAEDEDDGEPLAFGEAVFHDAFVNVAAHYRYNRVRPFVGIGGGLTLLEQGGDEGEFLDDSLGFGLQAFGGLGVVLTDNLDLEFKIDYTYRAIEVEDDFDDEFSADLDTLTLGASLVLRL